ncbi:MAG: CDP-alcohol phosphatidyltransferase family protein [Gammaproteobacteria bacterium]|jgi:phosphatidylglycerophosphate synthase|nr:CDP-alcohol phosphatidyltransferase family protein [Gammaproteobacteria bacterium]MDP6653128.1 CDP-alcohol phosphatidyltransferase family protein [Gammaproteobacteria bacterium]
MSEESPEPKLSTLRHIPNAITSVRVVIAAVFPFYPESSHLLLIGLGLVTEFLDGFTARTFKWTSYLGQILDPVADKLFVLSVSLTWVWLGKLTVLQWLLLGVRDFGVLFIFLALIGLGKIRSVRPVKARMPSKITTVLQYLVFLLVLTESMQYLTPLALLTAAIGLIATVHYAYLLRHAFR